MNAIIFGINGQDGFYLSGRLHDNNIKVVGVSRTKGNWIEGNVADKLFVDTLVKKEKPNYIFHLAANSTTKHERLFENHETISTGSLNILESVYRHSPLTKIFLSGSGLQFKNDGLPISENNEFEARDVYSIARIQSVYAARYFRSLGVKVYFGYFFNHDSPLRSERHVNQKIVQAAKRIDRGSTERIELGDITVKKEFMFAGDVAEAIWAFLQNDTIYEAVIGSGKAYSIEDWLSICFGYFNKDWRLYVTANNHLFKKDYDILVSNPKTILNLGWKQKTDIDALAKIMIEHDLGN
ncbi:MAG: GDP-mannose 4,6-dehydratase [Bacteroidota bacterium]|nr:GDP-mannose 4,6-dehydratase [Bacteroidota bacterium]